MISCKAIIKNGKNKGTNCKYKAKKKWIVHDTF